MRGPALDVAMAAAAAAAPGEVLATATVRDLVAGAGLAFAARDAGALPGPLYAAGTTA